MARPRSLTRETAESLAISALTYLASDAERLSRFLRLSGIAPGTIRAVAKEAGFLAGVLEYVAQDEALLVAFATEIGLEPDEITRAHETLAGRKWEHEGP